MATHGPAGGALGGGISVVGKGGGGLGVGSVDVVVITGGDGLVVTSGSAVVAGGLVVVGGVESVVVAGGVVGAGVVGAGDVVTGDGAVVVGGVGVPFDDIAEDVATAGMRPATTAGRAAASNATSDPLDTPPLPLIPGGTGPDAEGVDMTPVR
jgi:hypothetical protein